MAFKTAMYFDITGGTLPLPACHAPYTLWLSGAIAAQGMGWGITTATRPTKLEDEWAEGGPVGLVGPLRYRGRSVEAVLSACNDLILAGQQAGYLGGISPALPVRRLRRNSLWVVPMAGSAVHVLVVALQTKQAPSGGSRNPVAYAWVAEVEPGWLATAQQCTHLPGRSSSPQAEGRVGATTRSHLEAYAQGCGWRWGNGQAVAPAVVVWRLANGLDAPQAHEAVMRHPPSAEAPVQTPQGEAGAAGGAEG